MFAYLTPAEVIRHKGLRIVLVRGVPSPWSQAAKTFFEIKGLDYVAAPLDVGGKNGEIVAWSGQNSAPVVAWNDERPIHRWQEILLLAERLALKPAMIPADPLQRVLMFGFANEICGERGIGWNRRLQMFARTVDSGRISPTSAALMEKYGYDAADAKAASARIAGGLKALSAQLKAQQARGIRYFVGDALSALDIYWTAFANLIAPLPKEQCPIPDAHRPGFTATQPEIVAALDPILIEHRDRIFKEHFRSPMEF